MPRRLRSQAEHGYRPGQYDQAIPCLKKALELQPNQAAICDTLAAALGEAGDLAGARNALEKLLSLIPPTAPASRAVKGRLDQAEALLALGPRLEDVVRGELKPKDFQQAMQFGQLCRVKQHYQAALRIYEQALSGNLCRCGTHTRILAAVLRAAKA